MHGFGDFNRRPDDLQAGDFTFTLTNGEVTGVSRTLGDWTVDLTLPSNATFSVSGTTITETLTGDRAVTVVTYTPEAADPSLYEISSVVTTVTAPSVTDAAGASEGYGFTIVAGEVTGEQLTHSHGTQSFTHDVALAPGAVFTVGADGSVTEVTVQGHAVITTEYVQPSAGSLYAVASVSAAYIDPGSATTLLSVDARDRLEFTFDASGAVAGVARVNPDGTTSAVTAGSHTSFTDLGSGYVQETTTFGSHTSYEVYYAGQDAGGVYTEVAHGSGSTVDLPGLQAQIAQLPSSVGWII